MALSPIEILELRQDTATDKLLWSQVRRFMSKMLISPDDLGATLGLNGAYTPTAKEKELAVLECRQPNRFRDQVLSQIYDNLETLLPDVESANQVLLGLRDGSISATLMPVLAEFAPKVAEILIEDSPDNAQVSS